MSKKLESIIEKINIEISHYETLSKDSILVNDFDSAKLFQGIAIGFGKAKDIFVGTR